MFARFGARGVLGYRSPDVARRDLRVRGREPRDTFWEALIQATRVPQHVRTLWVCAATCASQPRGHRREWSCVNAPSWLTYRLGTLALALALAAGMSLAIRPEMRPLLRFCAAAV